MYVGPSPMLPGVGRVATPMSSVRCSMEALSVRLFCPRSISGTGYLYRSPLTGSPFGFE